MTVVHNNYTPTDPRATHLGETVERFETPKERPPKNNKGEWIPHAACLDFSLHESRSRCFLTVVSINCTTEVPTTSLPLVPSGGNVERFEKPKKPPPYNNKGK